MDKFLSGLNGFLGTAGSAYQAHKFSEAAKKTADAEKRKANAKILSSENMKKVAAIAGLVVGGITIIYFATRGK